MDVLLMSRGWRVDISVVFAVCDGMRMDRDPRHRAEALRYRFPLGNRRGDSFLDKKRPHCRDTLRHPSLNVEIYYLRLT